MINKIFIKYLNILINNILKYIILLIIKYKLLFN